MNRLKKERQLMGKEAELTLRAEEGDYSIWFIDFKCPENCIYAGEAYTLLYQTQI